jgi:hypothetical protein
LDSFDILKWWEVHKERFPTLSKLARMILMVPATSIASELAFSTSGRVHGNFQSQISPIMPEALVCGQDWICTEEGLQKWDKEEEKVYAHDIEVLE